VREKENEGWRKINKDKIKFFKLLNKKNFNDTHLQILESTR